MLQMSCGPGVQKTLSVHLQSLPAIISGRRARSLVEERQRQRHGILKKLTKGIYIRENGFHSR
jgi:hypothetical protein